MGPLTPDGWFVWITGALWITSQLPYMGAFGVHSFSVDVKDRYWVAEMELCHHFLSVFIVLWITECGNFDLFVIV